MMAGVMLVLTWAAATSNVWPKAHAANPQPLMVPVSTVMAESPVGSKLVEITRLNPPQRPVAFAPDSASSLPVDGRSLMPVGESSQPARVSRMGRGPAAPPASAVAWSGPPAYPANTHVVTVYRPLVSPAPPPIGYVVGRGILGQPKLYVPGQPLRNALRFVTP